MKYFQDRISKPLGSQEILETKVATVLRDTHLKDKPTTTFVAMDGGSPSLSILMTIKSWCDISHSNVVFETFYDYIIVSYISEEHGKVYTNPAR